MSKQCLWTIKDAKTPGRWNCQAEEHPAGVDGQDGHVIASPEHCKTEGLWVKA